MRISDWSSDVCSSDLLLRRGQHERLPTALATIEERARHLEGFIRDYARFAKLPSPRLPPVEWRPLVATLRSPGELVVAVHPAYRTTRQEPAKVTRGMAKPVRTAAAAGDTTGGVKQR